MFAMNYDTLADGFEGSYYKDLSARLKRGAWVTVRQGWRAVGDKGGRPWTRPATVQCSAVCGCG